MRTKDFLDPAYEFGSSGPDKVDVCFMQQELCSCSSAEAKTVIAVIDERGAAIQWLLDRVDPALRLEFAQAIDDLAPTHFKMHTGEPYR